MREEYQSLCDLSSVFQGIFLITKKEWLYTGAEASLKLLSEGERGEIPGFILFISRKAGLEGEQDGFSC